MRQAETLVCNQVVGSVTGLRLTHKNQQQKRLNDRVIAQLIDISGNIDG